MNANKRILKWSYFGLSFLHTDLYKLPFVYKFRFNKLFRGKAFWSVTSSSKIKKIEMACGKELNRKYPRPQEIIDLSYWNTSEEMVKTAHNNWAVNYEQVSTLWIC